MEKQEGEVGWRRRREKNERKERAKFRRGKQDGEAGGRSMREKQ